MKISERADHASDRRQQQTDIGWYLELKKSNFKTVRRSPATQIPLLQTKYYYLHAQLSTFNFESSMQIIVSIFDRLIHTYSLRAVFAGEIFYKNIDDRTKSLVS